MPSCFKRKGRKKANSFELLDEIWGVFDKDEHSDFDQAVHRCHEHGVRVARSNPCFEVWLILHFEDFHCPMEDMLSKSTSRKSAPAMTLTRGKQ